MNPLWILVSREFSVRIVKRGFWIATILGVVLMVGITFLPTIMNSLNRVSTTSVLLNDPHSLVPAAAVHDVNSHPGSYPFRLYVDRTPSVNHLDSQAMDSYMSEHHSKFVVVVEGTTLAKASFVLELQGTSSLSGQSAVQAWLRSQVMTARSKSLPPSELRMLALPVSLSTRQWQSGTKSMEQLVESSVLVYVLLFLLFFTCFMYGMFVAQGLVEEKSNRVVEMILIAARPWQVLFGKIIGLGLLALIQYALWIGAALVSYGVRGTGVGSISAVPVATIAWFPVFFVFGYLLYASLFAIAGSLVHRTEDLQMAVAPVNIPIVIVFYVSLYSLYNPSGIIATIASFIPIFTPLTMFVRIAMTDVPVWQVLVSLVLTAACIFGFIAAGARTYRRFSLKTSGSGGWKILFRNSGA